MNENIKNIESKRVKSEVECMMKESYFEKKGDCLKKKPRNKCKRLMKYLCLKFFKKKHFN